MRLRWPFLASLAALALGLAAWAGIPQAEDAWKAHKQHVADEKLAAQLQPATAQLRRVTPPASVASCASISETRTTGYVCWRSNQTPVTVSVTLANELRRVGGTEVRAQCIRKLRLGVLCRVSATLADRHFSSLAGPNTDQPRSESPSFGTWLQGDLMFGAPLLPRGTPVAVPDAQASAG